MLFSAAILILPEYFILRPIIRLFGISPIGPVKGILVNHHVSIEFDTDIMVCHRLCCCMVSAFLFRRSSSQRELVCKTYAGRNEVPRGMVWQAEAYPVRLSPFLVFAKNEAYLQ